MDFALGLNYDATHRYAIAANFITLLTSTASYFTEVRALTLNHASHCLRGLISPSLRRFRLGATMLTSTKLISNSYCRYQYEPGYSTLAPPPELPHLITVVATRLAAELPLGILPFRAHEPLLRRRHV